MKSFVLLLIVAAYASLSCGQEVRIVYELDSEETNGTLYTPAFDGSTFLLRAITTMTQLFY